MNAQTQGHHPDAEPHPFTEFNPDGSVNFDFKGDGPIFNEKSKVLILGSFPPKRSKEAKFYYGDTNNKFWFVLGTLFDEPNLAEKSKDEKKDFLRDNEIALWDIWAYCYKENFDDSSDNAIKFKNNESEFVNLTKILETAKIQKVFTTIDRKCFKTWHIEDWLWDKYAKYFPHRKTKSEIVVSLYSTSFRSRYAKQKGCPKLLDDYRQIKDFL